MNKFNWLLNSTSNLLGEYLWVVILVSVVVGIIVIVAITLTLIFQIRKTRLHKEEIDRQLRDEFLYTSEQKIILNKNEIIEEEPQRIEYKPENLSKRTIGNSPKQTTTYKKVVTKSSSDKVNNNGTNSVNNRQGVNRLL